MTDEQLKKDSFVRNELRALAVKLDRDIADISYSVTDVGEEIVEIKWVNGYKRKICVTGDSFKGIVWDVLRHI